MYYEQRRFREKWEDVSEEIQEKDAWSAERKAWKVDTVEARALRNDLMVILPEKPYHFRHWKNISGKKKNKIKRIFIG